MWRGWSQIKLIVFGNVLRNYNTQETNLSVPKKILPQWTRASSLPQYYYPRQKKEPSSRFAARTTLFHVWYHPRSRAISAGQVRSATVRDFCPALIAPDRAWYHTWNSVLLAANLEDGSFFVLGSSYMVITERWTESSIRFSPGKWALAKSTQSLTVCRLPLTLQ